MRFACNGETAEREADSRRGAGRGGQWRRHRGGQGGVRARGRARSARRQGALFPRAGRRAGRRTRAGAAAIWRAHARGSAGRCALGRIRARRRWRGVGGRRAARNAARATQDVAAAADLSPRAAQRHDPRHGRAAGRAAAPGRLRRRRLAAAGARLYGAGRPRQGASSAPTMPAARWPSDPDKLRQLDELAKGLGLEG